jgi:hypothetical protein
MRRREKKELEHNVPVLTVDAVAGYSPKTVAVQTFIG